MEKCTARDGPQAVVVDKRMVLRQAHNSWMKKLSQSVSIVLCLLMLAPVAYAQAICHRSEEKECSKSCCDGMSGMAMAMDDTAMASTPNDKLEQAPCCSIVQKDATQSAPEAVSQSVSVTILQPAAAVQVPLQTTVARRMRLDSSPGDPPSGSFPARLCTFLI